MTGAEMIARERRRQVSAERYSARHDDQHDAQELVDAAQCYLRTPLNGPAGGPPLVWPFERSAWKPKDRISDLVRAGALIAAEIDRLRRAAGSER